MGVVCIFETPHPLAGQVHESGPRNQPKMALHSSKPISNSGKPHMGLLGKGEAAKATPQGDLFG